MLARTFSNIGVCFFFFCFPVSLLPRLCILLLILSSGNVYSNSGPIFFCFACSYNVTWSGKSVQSCSCSHWIPLRCSLFPSLSLNPFLDLTPSAFRLLEVPIPPIRSNFLRGGPAHTPPLYTLPTQLLTVDNKFPAFVLPRCQSLLLFLPQL